MKEFLKKYKIIIVLVVMIVILAFVKSYFGNKMDENNSSNTNTPTPTVVSNKTNKTTVKITTTPSPTSEKVNTSAKESDSQNSGLIISNEKTDNRHKELVEKSGTFQTEEEYNQWFETLSFEDQELLLGDKPIQVSQLKDELPYEGKTFIIKTIMSNSVIQVKSKIDDLEKAEVDVRNWLSSKAMNFEDLVISWE